MGFVIRFDLRNLTRGSGTFMSVKLSIGGGQSSPSTMMWFFSHIRLFSSEDLSRTNLGGRHLRNNRVEQKSKKKSASETYDDFIGSVYWTPCANSKSDASFLRAAMAARISASTSSAFSAAVFFAS